MAPLASPTRRSLAAASRAAVAGAGAAPRVAAGASSSRTRLRTPQRTAPAGSAAHQHAAATAPPPAAHDAWSQMALDMGAVSLEPMYDADLVAHSARSDFYARPPPAPEAMPPLVSLPQLRLTPRPLASSPPTASSTRWDWRTRAFSRLGAVLPGHAPVPVPPAPPPPRRIMPTVRQLAGLDSHGAASAARQELRSAAATYVAAQRHKLALERAETQAALLERSRWRTPRLVAAGYALDGLQAYWRAQRRYGKRIAVFTRPARAAFPWTRLQAGDGCVVVASAARSKCFADADARLATQAPDEPASPLPAVSGLPATVLSITPDRLTLAFDGVAALADLERGNETWCVVQGENTLVHERTDAALQCLAHDVASQEGATRELPSGEEAEVVLRGTRLADVLLGLAPAQAPGLFEHDMRIRSWVQRRLQPAGTLRVEGDPDLGLNESQERAVAMMLGNRLSLVQGPPGTGKTRTIVAAMKLLKLHFEVPHPILLCAHTNVAVDNLALGAQRAGLRVVRAGPSARVRDELRGCTLDELVEAHPQKRQLDELRLALARTRAELAALEAAKRKGELQGGRGAWKGDFEVDQFDGAAPVSDATAPQLKARIAKQHGRAFMLEQQILSSILRSADVICCTALASASAALRALDFPLVFFDEGSMATEAVSLVPLMKGCAQLAVIGDHRQLPPVVTSAAARREGLALSLFERLLRRADVPSTMLDTQHRMHPRLAAFPNAAFYNGALHDGAPTLAIPAVQSRFLPAEAGGRIAFVTHSARETRADKSLVNLGEAALLARIVVDVLVRNAGLRGRDIGIVVPYAAQVRLLRRMLQERESEEHAALLALFAKEQGGRARAAEAKEIEVHTVDGFEGREKRLILFGSVRNSSSTAADAAGSVGFLADVRRLCVALTRAQAALIVVGHLPTWRAARVGAAGAELLASAGAPEDAQLGCQMLRRFADWAEQCGAVVVCDQETAPALRDDAHELDLFGM